MANTFEFTDQNFQTEAQNGLVLVDFWAPWCGPCRMVGPIIEELATEFQGKIKVGKMNVDDNGRTPMTFQVRGIPTVILLKDGQLVETIVGYKPKREYLERINKYLPAAVN
jgi:thioredoxin 1